MDVATVRAIADAVLYEGYVLYPYRASSVKNRHRWTFGSLLPRAWADEQGGLEPSHMETQCLVEAGPGGAIDVKARFLQLARRTTGHEGDGQEGRERAARYDAWGEGIPREIDVGPVALAAITFEPAVHTFAVPGDDHVVAGVAREQRPLAGTIEIRATPLGDGVHRVTVRIANVTKIEPGAGRAEAELLSLASTHAILGVRGGAFVSLIDPPPARRADADACTNASAWPVLVGEPGARDRVLASPIILYDYPAIAPESPGDLFDATEIDEILTLRILTLTDDEKREVADTDERARELLERTSRLEPADLARLHGALRRVDGPEARARPLREGDPVVVRPRGGADAIDVALAGRRATVVAIERDFEDRVHVAVTIDDDPGRDLGRDGKPGHRFFFRPDELERLGEGARDAARGANETNETNETNEKGAGA